MIRFKYSKSKEELERFQKDNNIVALRPIYIMMGFQYKPQYVLTWEDLKTQDITN